MMGMNPTQESIRDMFVNVCKAQLRERAEDYIKYDLDGDASKFVGELQYELCDSAWEYFEPSVDVYYSQTKSRGDIDDVWEAMLSITDEQGITDELFEHPKLQDAKDSPLVRCNTLVNLVAHYMAGAWQYDAIQGLLGDIDAGYQITTQK